MSPELVLDRRGPSLVVRLNRPEARNALTPALIAGLGAAVAEAEADPAIRALLLTGTGDRAFCAGMELVRMPAADAARAWERLGELQTVVFTSKDAKEGAMAFIEKRSPQWTGA